MTEGLVGKVALVTGAASGMGFVIARSLAAAGAEIAAVDINRDGLVRLTGDPALAGRNVLECGVDVARAEQCRAAVNEAVSRFGRLDILINCAGISLVPITPSGANGRAPFWQIDPDGWQRVHDVNNIGAFQMARYAVEPMMAAGWGRIINVTTSLDTMLAANFSPYGSSKAALEAASAAWAKELAGTGVTVNVLVPGGPTDTPFLPEETRRTVAVLDPGIMGPPATWLASADSDGVTGCRFVAREWDASAPPHVAATRARAPAGWEEVAMKAQTARGFASTR